MSYLDPTRIHFAGRFQANVSTVNNDPDHFDIETFKENYQKWGRGTQNGWWNPEGSGDWRLFGCKVTGAWVNGAEVAPEAPELTCQVADSDSEVPAKLVDLDPDQQMVSQIWGMTVRIVDSAGKTLMSGQFEPCAFFDLWSRAQGQTSGDFAMGAHWHSVLTDVEWSADLAQYPALEEMKRVTQEDTLSIKFNVDGFSMSYSDEDFTTGRIVGTIGPYYTGEPRHMLRARQLATTLNGITPALSLNKCYLALDADAGNALIDLGNALPTETPGGPLSDLGELRLGHTSESDGGLEEISWLGDQYPGNSWYEKTAGIIGVQVPPRGRDYDSATLAVYNLERTALALENPAHAYLQSDTIVARMSPRDSAEFPIYAVQNGRALANTEIAIRPRNSSLPADPTGVLDFPNSVTTNEDGVAILTVIASDPKTPRWRGGAESGPDGQVYALTPSFKDAALGAGQSGPWNFISFHVYSHWAPQNDPPTWDDIQPVMQQYENLYPVMARFLELGDEESVKGNIYLLKLAFELPENNPNHMPVTRDLSAAKRKAILQVLDTLSVKKAAGEAIPRPPAKPTQGSSGEATESESVAQSSDRNPLGGKSAALMKAGMLSPSEGDDQ